MVKKYKKQSHYLNSLGVKQVASVDIEVSLVGILPLSLLKAIAS